MTEPFSITSALKGLMEGAQKLQEIGKRVDQADLREAIIEAREKMLDAREALGDARQRILELEDSATAKANFQERLDRLHEVNGYYYHSEKDAEAKMNAYCPVCIERGDGLFRTGNSVKSGMGRGYACPNCNAHFQHFS